MLDELSKVASLASENIVTLAKELNVQNTKTVKQIVQKMPLIYFQNKQGGAFVHIHECAHTPRHFWSFFDR